MSTIANFNFQRSVVEGMHDSQVDLIQKVCTTLGKQDMIDPMLEMYVDKTYLAMKRKKDANAPRVARNAYQVFCDSIRPRVQTENPSLKMPAHSTLMSLEWKALTDEQKGPFQAKAEEDKLRFAEEMNAYEASIFKLESASFKGNGAQNASAPSAAAAQ